MADLLPAGTLPKITLWASISLKTVVINMHSIDLLWLDEDPLEWVKMCFALILNHNMLRNTYTTQPLDQRCVRIDTLQTIQSMAETSRPAGQGAV